MVAVMGSGARFWRNVFRKGTNDVVAPRHGAEPVGIAADIATTLAWRYLIDPASNLVPCWGDVATLVDLCADDGGTTSNSATRNMACNADRDCLVIGSVAVRRDTGMLTVSILVLESY